MQEQEQQDYDWQLPPYKPLHVGTNLGYRSQPTLTPRFFNKQLSQLTDDSYNKCSKYHAFHKSLLQHLHRQSCVYRKFEPSDLYELRELNHGFLKIGQTRLNSRAILNKRLEGEEAGVEKSNLRFDSAFQSGNLLEAYEISDGVFHLVLQNDTDSLGFHSWFNFKVQNLLSAQKEYTFCIINMRKLSSLYRNGMQSMAYSKELGWHRRGSKIRYFKNGLNRQAQYREYITLEWQCNLGPLQEVQFASSIPYTVSDLQAFLSSVRPLTKYVVMTRETLGYSYLSKKQANSDNRMQVLTVTDNQECPKRQVLLMGRVHPEETAGSYIIQGILKLLLSDQNSIRQLLKNYKFHIVPMVNPDGVVLGNSRCGALGKDMNRLWACPQLDKESEVLQLKKYIKNHRKISLIVDFHSQMKKKGCFVYGVHSYQHPFSTRKLPFVLSQLSPDIFSFRESNFYCGMDVSKTARKIIWDEFKIPVFSYECSICNIKTSTYLNVDDYWRIAKDFISALLILAPRTESQYKDILIKNRKNGWKEMKEIFLAKLISKQQNYEIGLRNQYEDSDSEPEQDYAIDIPNKQQRNNLLLSIEELSHRLKTQAGHDKILKLKKKQYANFLQQRFSTKVPKDKKKSKSYQKHTLQEINKLYEDKGRYSSIKVSPTRRRSSIKYKKLQLSPDAHPQQILYTEMDSQRDRIRSIISQSRSQHKKLHVFLQERKRMLQKSPSSQEKNVHQRILTLPDDIAPENLRNLRNKRKSYLINTMNVVKIWKRNVKVNEFLDEASIK